MARALTTTDQSWENSMLSVYVENIGEMAVVQCEGRIVRSEAAFKLREAVCSQRDARIIVLDLSEVQAIEGGGLGMLVFLQRWAQEHDIRLKLFNPHQSALDRWELAGSMPGLDIATLEEIMALLAQCGHSRYAPAV
jgi:anti-anti-sigma regulatory factor